ncbi:NAD(P)H-binding protein [Nonomuraea sp. NPDC050536]|uniref:NAD(P)H-binding protein n=1 Tax=Nonomuraea sp. NPDC050536 TaxID=3364366 RepID=UPI0037C7B33E
MILVTGATGLVGRPLIERLVEAGAKVRAVTRDPSAADLPAGVEVVPGDPRQPESIALDGVTSVLLNPRAVGTAAPELLRRAREHGARRVVAMAALNVDFPLERQPSRLRGDFNKEVEQAAVESGLEWVSLRSGCYAFNTLGSWGAQIRAGDVVRGAYPEARWAPLHELDLAAVAAQALLTDALLSRKPVLTGPEALTAPQMVAHIAEATGRPLRYEQVTHDEAVDHLESAGIPRPAAAGFLALEADSYGQRDLVTAEVEGALGRPALPFSHWAALHAPAFTSQP